MRLATRLPVALAPLAMLLLSPACAVLSPVGPPGTVARARGQLAGELAPDPTGSADAAAAGTSADPAAARGAAHGDDRAAHDHDDHDDEDHPDDGELDTVDPSLKPTGPAPLAHLSDEEIVAALDKDLGALGSITLGATNAGALFSARRMPESERWQLVSPNFAWGTDETVEGIARAIDAVHARFPDTPPMFIGHISARGGGYLSPHLSHQAGRDADLSYYIHKGHVWYRRATAANLDRDRTWAFVRALVTDTDVELILVDSSIQRLLKEHAASIGEDLGWLDEVFQYGSRHPRPLVRHAKGHATHLHVRFHSPRAQELGRRAHAWLLAKGKVRPPVHFVEHKAKKGDTLGSLANRYGTTPEAIQKANGLRSSKIFAKKVYRIPKKGGVRGPPPRVVVPPRRLPPRPPRASRATDESFGQASPPAPAP